MNNLLLDQNNMTWDALLNLDGPRTLLVDLGTTSISLALLDNKSGQLIDIRTVINPQRQWGMDVMSRITAIQRQADLLDAMQKAIIQIILSTCQDLCPNLEQIARIFVAGNAVMNHILLGQSPISLGQYPYELAFQSSQFIPFNQIGLTALGQGQLITLPNISAFIGGDIVAGILKAGLQNVDKTRLFIDVGTNGELVLAHNNKYFATSCAAGPALEGMNITCGMLAQRGAIEEARFTEGLIQVTTIENSSSRGICGSGILAVIREGLKEGIIDYRGRLQPNPSYEEMIDLDQKRLYLDEKRQIFISQKDIRQIQLAKGAIRAAIDCLLKEARLEARDIEQVMVSGQFGSYIQPQSFTVLGMFPHQWENCIHYLGNASLKGCQIFAGSPLLRKEAEYFVKNIHQIDLNIIENFERIFARSLLFPKGVNNE